MGFKIYSAKKFCINEPIENGKTFKENSLIKSKNAAKKSGIPAIADDSGLCILSLGITEYSKEKNMDMFNFPL